MASHRLNMPLIKVEDAVEQETGVMCELFHNKGGDFIDAYWVDKSNTWNVLRLRYANEESDFPHEDDLNLLIVTLKLTV